MSTNPATFRNASSKCAQRLGLPTALMATLASLDQYEVVSFVVSIVSKILGGITATPGHRFGL